MAAEARDACESRTGTCGEGDFGKMRREAHDALRRTFEGDGNAAVILELQRVRRRSRHGCDRERE
jgi:hypothetical protein